MAAWFECDQRFIAAHYQPALLADLALSRGLDSHRLLRGSGLFLEDLQCPQHLISPQQLLQLVANVQQQLQADDSAFLWGARLWPGHYGAASHALHYAATLQEALEHLVVFRALLSPLLSPRVRLEAGCVYVHWLDACGGDAQGRFLQEACMAGLASCTTWLAGEKLPWQFEFPHAQPDCIEQYWAHLGEQVSFQRQQAMMWLPAAYLHRPWPQASAVAVQLAARESLLQRAALPAEQSLLDHLYGYLEAHIREPLSLERVAAALELSPATLKRKLRKHGTHFQAQVDLVRKHVALYLYQVRGYSNEAVADYLQYRDTTNFRRSFKRWTGLSPSVLRQLLSG